VADDNGVVMAMDDEKAERTIDDLLAYEPTEDALMRWKREALEAEAARANAQVQTTAELNQQRTRDWEQWADARIARALAEHDRVAAEATGEAIAEFVGKKLAKLEARIAALEGRQQRGFDDGDVLDLLPASPTIRKIRSA
jgi:hypothetical protein